MSSKFIQLTSIIINSSKISTILKKESQYVINMINTNVEGAIILGSGTFGNHNNVILVDREKHKNDYEKMTKWIQENSN